MNAERETKGPALPSTALRIDVPTGNGSAAKLRALSSFEPYELADYLGALKERLPDIAIELWRMPTATLTDYLLAGARADLIIGWADTASATPGIARLYRAAPCCACARISSRIASTSAGVAG